MVQGRRGHRRAGYAGAQPALCPEGGRWSVSRAFGQRWWRDCKRAGAVVAEPPGRDRQRPEGSHRASRHGCCLERGGRGCAPIHLPVVFRWQRTAGEERREVGFERHPRTSKRPLCRGIGKPDQHRAERGRVGCKPGPGVHAPAC